MTSDERAPGAPDTASELDSAIRKAIATIRSTASAGIGHVKFADFPERFDGHPGVEEAFDDAIAASSRLWGTPRRAGFGPGHSMPDTADVPIEFIRGALRYAYWSRSKFDAAIVMLSHDADSIRSFELRMRCQQVR